MIALALLLALAGTPAPAAAPGGVAGGGALRVSADPPRLVLGRDGSAELRVWAPPEVEELQLTVSAGRVEGIRRLPQGGFAARYRPPAERIPQVALVAALARTSRGLADGWLAIPLSGQGDARVRARPGAQISLRIGDAVFGPRVAGEDGTAVIPVVVPPGVREAHHGFRAIDLHVPEMPLLHAVADRDHVHADQAEVVRVLAYVVAPHGAARRGDVPVFEPSRGWVSVTPREPGAFEATWALPAGASGEDRLLVRLPGSPPSRAWVRLDAVAGPPATVAVAFDREALVAGEAEEVRVTARVLDAAGNPVEAPLALSADAGELGPTAPAAPGEVGATLRVASSFGGRQAITVTARAPEAGIAGTRSLPLRPGAPAHVTVTPGGPFVRADGAAEAELRVVVLDGFENSVALAAAPKVTAAAGAVTAVDADGDGWRVRFRPPAVAARAEAVLVAEAAGVRGEAALTLLPPRGRPTVRVGGGALADVRGRFAAPALAVGVELPARLPLPLGAGDALAWRLEGAGLGWSVDGPRATGGGPPRLTDDLGVRGGLLAGGLAVRRALRSGPELSASATAGLLLTRAERAGADARTALGPAARLAVGASVPLGPGAPFLEASLLAAGRSGAGAFAAMGFTVGYELELGGATWRRSSSSTTSR